MKFLNSIEKAERLTTNILGLLKGANGKVAQAVAGTDYATPTNVSDAISDHNSDGSAHSDKYFYTNATLDTTWTGSAAPYEKSVSVTGILETDTPIIDVTMSGTYATDEARIEAWGYVYRAVTANNSITFYASEKPTVNLPVQIKVVR